MRIVFVLVAFTWVSYYGEGKGIFCPQKCSKDPDKPVVGCIYQCQGLRLGKYYDGTPCYILRRLGRRYGWIGNCSKTVCVKWGSTRKMSDAQKYCYHRSTTQALPTTPNAFEQGTSPNVTIGVHEAATSSSNFSVSSPSTSHVEGEADATVGTANASASTQATSPTISSTTTEVQSVTTTEQETTMADNVTQPSPDVESSPDQAQNLSSASGATIDVSVSTPSLSPVVSSSGTEAKNVTPTEDTHDANAGVQVNSTAGTSVITDVESETTPSEETTEKYVPSTRYGPRPDFVKWRFTTITTVRTPEANASADEISSPATVSTRSEEMSEPTGKTNTTVSVIEGTVGENSSDNVTTTTTAVSPTSATAC